MSVPSRQEDLSTRNVRMSAPDDRLPLPAVTTWPSFPFEGDLRVREVEPYSDTEEPREGEPGGKPCVGCGPDDGYIWTNERWRLKTLAPFSPLPLCGDCNTSGVVGSTGQSVMRAMMPVPTHIPDRWSVKHASSSFEY